MTLPQLRIRTEFSFRRAFGPVAKVADRCAALAAPAAAIVDGGTWGHVRWRKACEKAGVRPIFGTELAIPQADGRKPTAWVLAGDTRAFYRFSSAAREPGADLEALFAQAEPGVIRFAGAALSDPETFDYVDINPGSQLQQRAALALAARTGKPLVVTSDNFYPAPTDAAVFFAIGGRESVTPQHILDERELRAALRCLDDAAWARAVAATHEAAERCASALPSAPIISVPGDLRALARAGQASRLARGHLPSWPEEYEARLLRELELVALKGYESYFLVVADLVAWAKGRMLVGPGRGSSAGSLLCYVLGITEVDPIPHGLLFERFIDLNRNDLPDIDIDFSDAHRDECFTYLAEKYGRDNVARIGNVSTLKPRSVLAEVCKRFGIPDRERFDVVNVLIEYSSGDSRYGKGLEDTLQNTETGRAFMTRNPKAALMGEAENHAWHTSVHAAGVIVSAVPVTEFCTVGADGVAQLDKKDAEALNLLKIDALGLRTLGLIEDAGVVTGEQMYALKLDDPAVFRVFNEKRFCGIFQFEGNAQRSVSAQIRVDAFRTLDHITALARPGPLGGGAANHYIRRAAGAEAVEFRHPSMQAYLGETLGVTLYQEQVMRIGREIGGFSWEAVTLLRKAMSGRKGEEYFNQQGTLFIEGAARNGVPPAEAEVIWKEICSFGAWGMNKSHTVAYSVISYWCAWMKAYHPLEYAAACLRHAKDDEQTVEILREMAQEGISYVAFDVETSREHWSVQGGKLVGGFQNLVGYGPAKASAAVAQRDAGKLDREKIAKADVKFRDLYPLMTAYGDIYRDPTAHGCRDGSWVAQHATLPGEGDVLYIGKITKKELRDENETVRVGRRDGRRLTGQTLFLDLFCSDDTGGPIICRIDRFKFNAIGRRAAEELRAGEDVLMLRGKRIPGFNMIKVERMRCLTRPEALEPQ